MTREELAKACTMRAKGDTYQAIADELGYTKQNVQQCIANMKNHKPHRKTKLKTIYPNLRTEIEQAYGSVFEFCESTGLTYRHVCDMIIGRVRILLDEAIFFSELFGKDIAYLFEKTEANK